MNIGNININRNDHKAKDFNKDLDGIEFLRCLVNTFNFRYEHLNEDKTPLQLIKEYEKVLNGEIDIYGTDLTDDE